MDDMGSTEKILIVGVVIGILIIAVVGALLIDSFHEAGFFTEKETFTVDDPTSDASVTLDYTPAGDTFTVQYHNGTALKTLTSSDYTQSGKTVTVKASAMN